VVLTPHKASTDAISTVRVITNDTGGHGSAVHIGDGFLLTAGHVAADAKEREIKDNKGNTQTAEVLWASTKYDLALLRVSNFKGLGASPLDCSKRAAEGSPVKLVGNPLEMEFVTTHGHVASAFALQNEMAHEWSVVDATVAPGMSGGPVLDRAGNVVGIVSAQPLLGRAPVPFTLMVPAKVACNLMGRR
jgi:S1-C subfamily serine protease